MKIKLLIIVCCIFSLNACVDLELNPLSEGSSENWFNSDEQFEMSVYRLFNRDFWYTLDDEDLHKSTDDWSQREVSTFITNSTINGQTAQVVNEWNKHYRAIAAANLILENISDAEAEGNIAEQRLNFYAANARFVRAAKYSKLIFFFGDVPFYTNVLDIDEAFTLSRMNKNEILQEIYKDFDFAIDHLPLNYGSGETKLITKGAALGMKAQIALYMEDYEVARDAAKECIDLGIYTLHPDFEELFHNKTKNSPEAVFNLPMSDELNVIENVTNTRACIPRTAGGFGSYGPDWQLFASFLCTDGLPIDESPLFNPREPFENRDPRCTKTIVEFGRKWLGLTFSPHPDSIKIMNWNTGTMVTNKDNRVNDIYARYNGLLWAKTVDEGDLGTFRADPDILLLRYADVLLYYAEAKIELGEIDEEVLRVMNQVRARAYEVDYNETSLYPAITTTDQSELRKILRIERQMEFAKEYHHRYSDLIRWRLAEKVLNTPRYGILNPQELIEKVVRKGLWFWPETPQIDEDGVADFSSMYDKGLIRILGPRTFDVSKQYLWPIPTKEILINPNLTQNPGY